MRGRKRWGLLVCALAAAAAPSAHAAGGGTATSILSPVAEGSARAGVAPRMARSVKTLPVTARPAVRSYLAFDLTGVDVASATLRLHADAAGTIRLNATAGVRSTAATGAIRALAGEWTEVDVTPFVRRGGRVTFVLEARSGGPSFTGGMSLANPPHLVVRTSGTTPAGQPTFPIRAAFYYPWYFGDWRAYPKLDPTLGSYQSGDPAAVRRHVLGMLYGGLDAGISSWWGPGDVTDRNLDTILDISAPTPFRWAVYYERESIADPSVETLHAHLLYLRNRLDHPAALRIGGRFVVFVYRDGADGCDMATRWADANRGVGAYIVLFAFPGFRSCPKQPDAWHAYDPSQPQASQGISAFEISPGFAPAKDTDPGRPLARDLDRWRSDVRTMLVSGARFQLVTTFNEWWESSSIESAAGWTTVSGYGAYLDVLHDELTVWRRQQAEPAVPLPAWSPAELELAPPPAGPAAGPPIVSTGPPIHEAEPPPPPPPPPPAPPPPPPPPPPPAPAAPPLPPPAAPQTAADPPPPPAPPKEGKPDRGDKPDRSDRPDRGDKPDKPDKPEKRR